VITDSEWSGEAVQTAAGRIYFEMPADKSDKRWNGYVCSGTAVTDDVVNDGQSIILTAAHCVFEDLNKVFARNVMFIPNQARTTVSGTDLNCDNDPLGCWMPTHGVVDVNWTVATFPGNIPHDYAYYVVPNTGAHAGNGAGPDLSLEDAVRTLSVEFLTSPALDGEDSITHALRYSYDQDPSFRYCAEGLDIEADYDDYWLPSCLLSGGSSGGPWIQPMDVVTGSGPIISVNSWGYTNSPGMAGPPLTGNSAKCVFDIARSTSSLTDPRGIVVTC